MIVADGYYFSARCPGEDSFYVDKDDVDACWQAVSEIKDAADIFRSKEIAKKDIHKELSDSINTLKTLDSFK